MLSSKDIVKLIKNNIIILVLFCIASFCFLTNLGGQYYSLDEPETILISKSILKSGLPLAPIGKSFISDNIGFWPAKINGLYIWVYQPWVQNYLAAVGLIFQDTPWITRIPFALTGVLTIIILYFISQEILKIKLYL